MITRKRVKKFASNNKWIIISALFFIAWKFFLIHTMFKTDFDDRRFNDASVYITHIKSISDCPSMVFCRSFIDSFAGYGGFEHLTYRLFFGTLGKIFDINAQNTFFLSFYIGTLMMVPVLIVFLRKINPNKNLIAFSLFFLALYNGAGSYHGFFWVVPSFFSLLLFFLIFSIIAGNHRYWKPYLLILTPLMLYTHYLGLYLLSVLIFFLIFYSLFHKKIDGPFLKKTIFTIIIAMFFYIPTSLYLKDGPYGGNPYGIGFFTKQAIANVSLNNSPTDSSLSIKNKINTYFPSANQIKTDYFNFIFPHWTFIFIFITVIGILFFYKQYFILSLFFSCIIFTFISSMTVHGVRSLIIIWPVTFILYAQGAWLTIKSINENNKYYLEKYFFNTIMILSIFIFVISNMMYSYFWNDNLQKSVKKTLLNVLIVK